MAREGVSLQQSLFTALQTEHAQRQAALREENGAFLLGGVKWACACVGVHVC